MAHQLLTGRFPFDDKRSPGNPTISKIWWALLPCLKLMDFLVTSKAVTLSRQGLLIRPTIRGQTVSQWHLVTHHLWHMFT